MSAGCESIEVVLSTSIIRPFQLRNRTRKPVAFVVDGASTDVTLFPEEPTLNWLTAALRSTVGQKFVMGFTGLFLCLFLVIHLVGNLFLYFGADAYNAYAHAIHQNEALLIAAEVILYLAFAAHLYIAISLTRANWAARQKRYAMRGSKIEDRTINVAGFNASNTMFVTGTIILAFLILHLADFKFGMGWDHEGIEPYSRAAAILSDYGRQVAYALGSLFVGVHVSHGFASTFQSLGVNHPKYNRWIRIASWIFAIVIALGFMSFSIWGLNIATQGTAETVPDSTP